MRYSFCSVTYGSMGSLTPAYTLEDTICRLSDIGYDAIEIVCSSPHAWPYYLNQEKREKIAALLSEKKLSCSSVMAVPGGGPGCNVASVCREEREWTIQYIKDVLDLAETWNCKRLAFVAGWAIYGTSRKTAWNNSLDTLKQVGEYALKKDITICIEPTATDSNVVECPDDALEMIEESGLPNVGMMFDVAHALFRQENPQDYVYMAGKHLKHVHFCDSDRLPPGSGTVDFYPIMKALKEIDYSDYIAMEIGFSRTTGTDSIARKSLEYLKKLERNIWT